MKQIRQAILFFAVASCVWACNSPLQLMKSAEKKMDNGQYDLALKDLQGVAKANLDPAKTNYLIAESYRLSNRFTEAASYYKMALDAGSTQENLRFHLAYCLKSLGKYEEAQRQLEQYIRPGLKNTAYVAKAQQELENLPNLAAIAKRKTPYQVKPVGVNTASTEFAPLVLGNDLVFTASKKPLIYKNNGLPFLGLYIAKLNNATETGEVQLFSSAINKENANEGTPTFTKDGKTMIFARGNTGKRKDLSPDVDLYIAKLYDGKWTEPELISVSDSAAWDGSPAFSGDGRTLYFASNRAGGKGGIDLYSAKMDNSGRFSRAVNMGSDINTAGDEMFPFVSSDGKLYFASDGHAGLGKLDIFVAIRKDGEIKIQNMGVPINSPSDDFGLIPLDSLKGYFASNREGGKGDDDIYFYENTQPNKPIQPEEPPVATTTPKQKTVRYFLAGVVKDTKGNLLDSVKVTLLDAPSKTALAESSTQAQGKFGKYRIEPEKEMIVLTEKPSYLTKRQTFSTIGKTIALDKLTKAETDTTYSIEIAMEKPEVGKTIDPTTFAIAPIYYDLNQAVIRIDASIELDKIVQVLIDNPTIKIELGSHTDSRATFDYNNKLSQRRANAAVTYIISKGIDPARITAKGYGESQLVNGCSDNVPCTEDQHQQNRRTEFKVTKIN